MSFSNSLRPLGLAFLTLLAAAVGPNIFPAAEAGYGELNVFAIHFLLPAIRLLIVIVLLSRKWEPSITRCVVWGEPLIRVKSRRDLAGVSEKCPVFNSGNPLEEGGSEI
jgi:hypothetical protein